MGMERTGKGRLRLTSPAGAEAIYAIGNYEEYTSIYGYPKRGVHVHKIMPGEELSDYNKIGFIKEERIQGPDGKIVAVCFYTREDHWKKRGQARFFNTPEALLVACGMVPVLGLSATKETSERAFKEQQSDPTKVVSSLPVELQGRLTHGGMLALPKPAALKLLHGPNGGGRNLTQLMIGADRKQASRSSARRTAKSKKVDRRTLKKSRTNQPKRRKTKASRRR